MSLGLNSAVQEDTDINLQTEELLLRNTYLNSQMGPLAVIYQQGGADKS